MLRHLHIGILIVALLAAQIHFWVDLDHGAGFGCASCACGSWALPQHRAVPEISLRAFHLEMAGGGQFDASHLVDGTSSRAPPC